MPEGREGESRIGHIVVLSRLPTLGSSITTQNLAPQLAPAAAEAPYRSAALPSYARREDAWSDVSYEEKLKLGGAESMLPS